MKTMRFLTTFLIGLLCAGLTACSDDSEDIQYGVLKDFKMTVKLEKAGSLPSYFYGDDVERIKFLSVIGDINGTDIKLIREMKILNTLDLSKANIVSGGEAYYSVKGWNTTKSYRTKDKVIGENMFRDKQLLKVVKIPNSVTSIEDAAFSVCSQLTSVTIPNSVTSIGGSAFSSCSQLTSVTIPNSVISIGGSAFSGCSQLTSVSIPSSVSSIGSNPFVNCTNLKEILVSEKNPNYLDLDGLLLNKEKTILLTCLCTKSDTCFIPDGVDSIGSSAFARCTGLTTVTIPNSVTYIDKSAFSYCSGLTTVTIGSGVTSIGDYAFMECSGLTTLVIPNSVTSIGDYAFMKCSGLTTVTIGSGVTYFDDDVFSNCSEIKEIHNKNAIPQISHSVSFNGVSVFRAVDKTTCILYVPKGSYSSYSRSGGWSDFQNIIEED